MDLVQEVSQDTERTITDSDIVPESEQNTLMYLRDTLTVVSFEIGDIANEIVSRVSVTGFAVTDQRVFEAVAKYCGKSARTVRYYAETSAFFDKDTRRWFDTVPFSHFVFARSLGSDYMEVLMFSDANPGVSLDLLRYNFTRTESVIARALEDAEREMLREESSEYSQDELLRESPARTQDGEHSQDNGYSRRFEYLSAISELSQAVKRVLAIAEALDDFDGKYSFLEGLQEVQDGIGPMSEAVNRL